MLNTVTTSLKCLRKMHSSISSDDFKIFLITSSSLNSSPFSLTMDSKILKMWRIFSKPKIYSKAILKFSNSPWSVKHPKLTLLSIFNSYELVRAPICESSSESSSLNSSERLRNSGICFPRIGIFYITPFSPTIFWIISIYFSIFSKSFFFLWRVLDSLSVKESYEFSE